jgi:hypothetical protein
MFRRERFLARWLALNSLRASDWRELSENETSLTRATKTYVSCESKYLETAEAAVCKNAGVAETVEYRSVSILINSYTAF